jgi:hypothetical protein
MLDGKSAESDDGYLLTLAQRFGDGVDDGVHGTTCVSFGKVGVSRDCIDEFRFVHSFPLKKQL